MGTIVHPTLIGQLVRHLPAPLLRALDAWSHRTARRRWAQRQAKWEQRKAPATPVATGFAEYKLRPWRD